MIAWPPYELDLSQHLRRGENELTLTVLGHRRNSHGPHGQRENGTAWTGSGSYQPDESKHPQTVPLGLIRAPQLV